MPDNNKPKSTKPPAKKRETIYLPDPNDGRILNYKDSLDSYLAGKENLKRLLNAGFKQDGPIWTDKKWDDYLKVERYDFRNDLTYAKGQYYDKNPVQYTVPSSNLSGYEFKELQLKPAPDEMILEEGKDRYYWNNPSSRIPLSTKASFNYMTGELNKERITKSVNGKVIEDSGWKVTKDTREKKSEDRSTKALLPMYTEPVQPYKYKKNYTKPIDHIPYKTFPTISENPTIKGQIETITPKLAPIYQYTNQPYGFTTEGSETFYNEGDGTGWHKKADGGKINSIMKYKNYKKKYELGGILPSQDASTSDALGQFAALAAVEKGVYDTTYNIGTEFLSKNYDQDQIDVLTQGSSKFKNIPFVGQKLGAVADTWNLISGKTKLRLADLDKAKMNESQDDYMNSYFNNFAPNMNTKLSFAEGGPLDFDEDDIKYNRSLKIKRNLFNKIVTTEKYTDEDGSQWKVKSKYNPKTKKNIEKYWVNGKFNGKLTNDAEPLYIPNSVQGEFNNQPKMQYAHGGNMKKHGVVQIPKSVGLHDENPQGGAIIGDASLEEQEILQYQDGLPSYVIPDQVNGEESIKMPMMDKDYNVITDTDGNITFSKKSPAQWLKHKLATRNKLREDIDSYAKPAVDQVNQIAQDATELNHLMNDISSTVQADNIAAYGGKINTKKYPGLNAPKKYYEGGGWTYDDYKPKPILGPVNPEYDPSVSEGTFGNDLPITDLPGTLPSTPYTYPSPDDIIENNYVEGPPLTFTENDAIKYNIDEENYNIKVIPNKNPNDFNNTINALVAGSQLAGPIAHWWNARKYDKVRYPKMIPSLLNPTPALRSAEDAANLALNRGMYEIGSTASSAGNASSNITDLALKGAKQSADTASAINRGYGEVNAGIENQSRQFNTQNEIAAMRDEAANKGQAATERVNAIYNAGANIAGMNRDYNINEVNKTIAANIGTTNYKLSNDGKTIIYRDPKTNNFKVKKIKDIV